MAVLNRLLAPKYTWGKNCSGWRLMDERSLSVIEEEMPPSTQEVRHFHEQSDQLFFVLDGELTLELDGATHVLRKNDAIHVRPEQAHQAKNESNKVAKFLVVSSPSTSEDRIIQPQIP